LLFLSYIFYFFLPLDLFQEPGFLSKMEEAETLFFKKNIIQKCHVKEQKLWSECTIFCGGGNCMILKQFIRGREKDLWPWNVKCHVLEASLFLKILHCYLLFYQTSPE